jgi:molybdate transport system permease protein
LPSSRGYRTFDPRWLDMARSLGAGPLRRFFGVTLPMVFPSVATGALLCSMRALGEYCATQLFAGNLAGTTRTLPLACGLAMETDPRLAVALSLLCPRLRSECSSF